MDHNFATIEVERLSEEGLKDLKVRFSIRDREGEEVMVREYSVNKELTLDGERQRYSKMCKQTHKRAVKILSFN